MGKDQCHVQTLRTLYLHGILLPWGLFIAKRSALKQTIMSSGFQDISNLVFSNLVNTDHLEMFLVQFERSS